MCDKTADDVLARMALVPRTLEARGLDASPPVRAKLAEAGDEAAAAIIDIILRDEVGHVAIGNHWYRWLCAQRGLDPVPTYAVLSEQYRAPRLRGLFNLEAAARRASTRTNWPGWKPQPAEVGAGAPRLLSLSPAPAVATPAAGSCRWSSSAVDR